SGFPGPYASYVQDTIGNKGILQIMNGIENRHAYFKTAIAYVDSSGVFVFTGQLDGEISHTEHGSNGFGYDPIFSVCDGKTLSDLTINEKNCISHRARALSAFKSWYMSHKLS
ncbi:MAG TPA: non-canonical purine NTP pyrophosphatase, partial [Methanocorpusculum sp.]|nr:non-canonical purine NTP pyrophosphatase [Methanocorpusculum sp.]